MPETDVTAGMDWVVIGNEALEEYDLWGEFTSTQGGHLYYLPPDDMGLPPIELREVEGGFEWSGFAPGVSSTIEGAIELLVTALLEESELRPDRERIEEQASDIGAEIEDMDMKVEPASRDRFDTILDRYIGAADPDLTIRDAVNALPPEKQQHLINELLDLYYEESR